MDGRRNPDGNQNYQIEELWDHHKQIIRLLVASNGSYTNEHIAQLVGCTAQTVSNVRNNPLAKARLEILHTEADKDAVSISRRIKEIAPIAIAVLEKTMSEALVDEDGDDKLRNAGVKSALGALEYAAPKKSELAATVTHITLEQIEKIRERARATASIPIQAEVVS